MTRDQLDDLLDASAPAARTIASSDVRAMVLDARAQAAPRQPRAKKAALVTGALALLMVGGAGVATASDYWAALNNPVGSYTYQVPSGATCEVVFGDVQIVERRDRARRDQLESELKAWFQATDVVEIAESQVDEYIRDRHDALVATGRVQGELTGYDLDMAYAYAIDQSISDQAMAEFERVGVLDEIAGYGSQGRCPELDK